MLASGQTADFVELASFVEYTKALIELWIDCQRRAWHTICKNADGNSIEKASYFWNEDTKGVTDLDEQRFVIQQKMLESFLTAIQLEMAAIA